MAKSNGLGSHGNDRPTKPTKTARFNDVRFVNYQLPKEVKEALKEKPFSPEQFLDALMDMNDAGYSVKFKYNSFQSCYECYVQQTDPKHANADMILPGRGSSPSKALKQACFIHYEVTQGHWEGFLEHKPDEIDD